MWTSGPALADHRLVRPPSPLGPRWRTGPGRDRQDQAPVRCMVKSTPRFSDPLSRVGDLTMKPLPWARRTPPAPKPSGHRSGLARIPSVRLDLAPDRVAGLAPRPDPVVALTAVPDALARPIPNATLLSGATRLAVVPLRPCRLGIGWPHLCATRVHAHLRCAPPFRAVDRSEERTVVVAAALVCFSEGSVASSRTSVLCVQRWCANRPDHGAATRSVCAAMCTRYPRSPARER